MSRDLVSKIFDPVVLSLFSLLGLWLYFFLSWGFPGLVTFTGIVLLGGYTGVRFGKPRCSEKWWADNICDHDPEELRAYRKILRNYLHSGENGYPKLDLLRHKFRLLGEDL